VQRQRDQRRAAKLRQVMRRLKPVMKQALHEVLASGSSPAKGSDSEVEASQANQTGSQSSAPSVETGLNQLEHPIEIVVVKPDYSDCRCPECGGATERVRWREAYSHAWDALTVLVVCLDVAGPIARRSVGQAGVSCVNIRRIMYLWHSNKTVRGHG
jgi:hypothetical protein